MNSIIKFGVELDKLSNHESYNYTISFLLFVIFLLKFEPGKKIVDKSELTGGDYRLFQNTPAWELAKAVEDGNTNKN